MLSLFLQVDSSSNPYLIMVDKFLASLLLFVSFLHHQKRILFMGLLIYFDYVLFLWGGLLYTSTFGLQPMSNSHFSLIYQQV